MMYTLNPKADLIDGGTLLDCNVRLIEAQESLITARNALEEARANVTKASDTHLTPI